MDNDLSIVIGVILGALAIPGIISGLVERRLAPGAIVAAMISAGLIVSVFYNNPGEYNLREFPEAFIRVFAKYFL